MDYNALSASIDQDHAVELAKMMDYFTIGLKASGVTDSKEIEKRKVKISGWLNLAKEVRSKEAGF